MINKPQYSFLIDPRLKKEALEKANNLKPKRKLADIIRILLEAWLDGEIDSRIFKKID